MAVIKVYDGTAYAEVEVTEELAVAYAEMERKERLTERRETRRHQSLDKSMGHGFDIPDFSADIDIICERHELSDKLYTAINQLIYCKFNVVLLSFLHRNN